MTHRERGLVSFLVLLCVLAGGIWLGGHPKHLPHFARKSLVESPPPAFDALDQIKSSYYKRVDATQLENHSIAAMVAYLRRAFHDDFSHYFDPDTYHRFLESTSGHFSGIGLTVNAVKKGLRVASVFDRSPAKGAGIRRGDVITRVGGRSIAGESTEVATSRVKGPEGTRVTVSVFRPATGRTRRLTIKRAEIAVPVVAGKIRRAGGKRFGYVALSSFTGGAHGELRKEIEKLYRQGAKGLVFDLRGNGGGLLTESVLISSIFLRKGELVVSTRRRRGSGHKLRAVGDPLPRRPMVILVDRGTASSSEIVTAALRESHLATVVGDCPAATKPSSCRTFGKGVFQEVIDLDNGGALDLTVGQFFTPKGISLTHRGVRADVRAADDPHTTRDEALDRALQVLARKTR